MSRVYATPDDYAAYTGQPATTDTPRLLLRASQMLDAQLFRTCYYQADPTTGLPTNALVAAAFRDAVSAQVQWWDAIGDSIGSTGAGWETVRIGTAHLQRTGNTSGKDSPAREIAPAVVDVLQAPELTPEILRIGLVVGW